MAFTAQSMMVSVRRPRKSNLTSPIASTSSLSNWVTTFSTPSPCDSQYSGTKSVSTEGAMTTPLALRPALRVRSSSERARSTSSRTASSAS